MPVLHAAGVGGDGGGGEQLGDAGRRRSGKPGDGERVDTGGAGRRAGDEPGAADAGRAGRRAGRRAAGGWRCAVRPTRPLRWWIVPRGPGPCWRHLDLTHHRHRPDRVGQCPGDADRRTVRVGCRRRPAAPGRADTWSAPGRCRGRSRSAPTRRPGIICNPTGHRPPATAPMSHGGCATPRSRARSPHGARIRTDGRVLRPMRLERVKIPADSSGAVGSARDGQGHAVGSTGLVVQREHLQIIAGLTGFGLNFILSRRAAIGTCT